MGMWEPHYVDPDAYTLLENRSKNTFDLLKVLIGNRPDFVNIIADLAWNNMGPLEKTDISSDYKDIVGLLNETYDDIDEQIVDIRVGVRSNVKSDGQGGLVAPKSILEIEMGIKNDKIFFYGLNSVIGRNITNSIAFKVYNDLSFTPEKLAAGIETLWGQILYASSESEIAPEKQFHNSVMREGLKKVSGGYEVRNNIGAKIANLTNVHEKPLKVYSVISQSLSNAGHFKSLYKTLDLMKDAKSLF